MRLLSDESYSCLCFTCFLWGEERTRIVKPVMCRNRHRPRQLRSRDRCRSQPLHTVSLGYFIFNACATVQMIVYLGEILFENVKHNFKYLGEILFENVKHSFKYLGDILFENVKHSFKYL